MRNAGEFVLLFSLALDHCGGGPGPNSFDMLPALEAWVEKGVAPASVTASRVVDGAASFRCESKP